MGIASLIVWRMVILTSAPSSGKTALESSASAGKYHFSVCNCLCVTFLPEELLFTHAAFSITY